MPRGLCQQRTIFRSKFETFRVHHALCFLNWNTAYISWVGDVPESHVFFENILLTLHTVLNLEVQNLENYLEGI